LLKVELFNVHYLIMDISSNTRSISALGFGVMGLTQAITHFKMWKKSYSKDDITYDPSKPGKISDNAFLYPNIPLDTVSFSWETFLGLLMWPYHKQSGILKILNTFLSFICIFALIVNIIFTSFYLQLSIFMLIFFIITCSLLHGVFLIRELNNDKIIGKYFVSEPYENVFIYPAQGMIFLIISAILTYTPLT